MNAKEPSPSELWAQADGDPVVYHGLMIEYGLIVKREEGDDSPVLPCGYGSRNE